MPTITEDQVREAYDFLQRHPDDPRVQEKANRIKEGYRAQQEAAGQPIFADSTQRKQQSAQALRKLYQDRERHGLDEETFQSLSKTLAPRPDEKFEVFNERFFAESFGLSKEQSRTMRKELLETYSTKTWGEPVTDDKAFYDRMGMEMDREDEVAKRGWDLAMQGENGFAADAAFDFDYGSDPKLKARSESLRQIFRSSFNKAKESISSLGISPKEYAAELQKAMGVGEAGGEAMPEKWFVETVLEMPRDRQALFLEAVAAQGGEGEEKSIGRAMMERMWRESTRKLRGISNAGTIGGLDSLKRSIVRGKLSSAGIPEEYGFDPLDAMANVQEMEPGEAGVVSVPEPGTPEFDALSDDQKKALARIDKEVNYLVLGEMVKGVAEGSIDPAKGSYWYASGAIGVAGMAPSIALMGGGVIGAGLNVAAYGGQATTDYLAEHPTASLIDATNIGMATGVIQGLLDKIPANIIAGKTPFFSKWLSSPTLTKRGLIGRGAVRLGAGTIFEVGQEFGQDVLAPGFVEELANVLKADLEDANWDKRLEAFTSADSMSELIPSIVMLSLIGTGVGGINDYRGGWQLVRSKRLLTAAGFDQETVDSVHAAAVAGDAQETQTLLREAFVKLDKGPISEVLPEAQKKAMETFKVELEEKKMAMFRLGQGGSIPQVVPVQGGFDVVSKDGVRRTFATLPEAEEARWAYVAEQGLEVHEDLAAVISRLDRTATEERRTDRNIDGNRKTLLDAYVAGEQDAAGVLGRADIYEQVDDQTNQTTPAEQTGAKVEAKAEPELDIDAEYQDASDRLSLLSEDEQDRLAGLDIIGESKTTFRERVEGTIRRLIGSTTTTTLRPGASWKDVIEEDTEGDAKVIIRNRRDWLVDKLFAVDADLRSGKRWVGRETSLFKDGVTRETVEDKDLIEAYSKLAVGYFVGTAKKGVAGGFQGSAGFRKRYEGAIRTNAINLLDPLARVYRAVAIRATKIAKMRRDGKLDAELERELMRSVGMTEQFEYEQQVTKEKEKILEEIDPDGVLSPIAESNETGYEYVDDRTATNRDSKLPSEISSRETGSSLSVIDGRVSQSTGDGRGRDSSRGFKAGASAPLDGAPRKQGATGPDLRIVDVARSYARSIGLPFGRQKVYATVDAERGERIAQAYDEMVHAPRDPVVAEAYANLIEQTTAQYRALEQAGFKFWFYDKTNDPYDGNPYNAMRELRASQSMGVFATEAGFGSTETASDTSDNAMMADTGIQWSYGSPDGPLKRVLANDLFRAVHDAFGHGLEGSGFRGRGEENAWQAHIRLYTGSAVGAITSETRGQNSWLNFGPYGEHNQTASVEETVFAEQKTGLMPEWTWTEGRVEHDVETTFSVIQSDTGRSVVVGARPGEFGWTPGGLAATEKEKQNLESELASLSDDPKVNAERIREIEEELRGIASKTLPGPVTHPTQKRPRLERVGEAAGKILKSGKAKKLLSDLYGVTGLNVKPIAGTWLGNREPSYVIQGESLTDEQAAEVGALFGFAWAQDATVVSRPNPSLTEGIPAYYLGSRKRLSETQINAIHEASRERGLDFSSTPDGKAVQFLFFGEEADLPAFTQSIADIKQASGLTESHQELVSSDLNETQTNFSPSDGSGRTKAWLHGTAEGLALFERVVSDLVAPYAKAIGAEGYRFNVDLYAKRFGLSDTQTEIVRKALYPAHGKLKSSVPIMDGSIDLGVEGVTKKNGRFVSSVTNVVWSLQNWSAQFGLIAPGDYSKQAGKLIAQTIADEVAWHVQKAKESGKRSAIGWYDRALKAAKRIYARMFSELDVNGAGYNADMAMVFDAMLGIASQGNNVTDNSVMNTRVYANWRRDKIDATGNINVTQGMTITQAVAPVTGTFGSKTVAIENNYLKLETLLANNSYAELRKFFNKTDTVGNINAYLRKNKNLWFNGEPLSVDGAAAQKVTGWMVFGPKIGSFINNLHGDYTTLTADLWFSRTWNRILGWSFIHSPEREAQNFISLRDAMVAEYTNDQSVRKIEKGKPVYWDHGTDVAKLKLTPEEFDDFINDPQKMLDFASRIEVIFRTGAREGAKKTTSYKDKSAVRRAAKTWVENRENVMEAPRSDRERMFQQDVMENAQKMLKKMGIDINIADMQAALWYNEKDLYATLGSTTKLSAPADYEDAAKTTFKRIQEGTLYERIGSTEGEVDERIQPREWEAAIFAGINLKSEDGDRTFSVLSKEIPINRMRRLMQQIDGMYSTGRTEGVENLEAELETLLEMADSDLEGMDEGDDADQVAEMRLSDISEVDSANPSPEEELINQWYRWTGKGIVDDSESLRETYPNFGEFMRSTLGDSAYVLAPGVTNEQIEEAAREAAANYERRRTAMLRSRVEKATFSVLSNAESLIADQYNPLFRDPDKRRKILVEGQKRVREKAQEFDEIVRAARTGERLDREQAARERVIYGDLLVQYFGADTEKKVNALPLVDRKAARSEAKRQAEAWRKVQDRQQKKLPRETMVAALRTLDAMISALPVELRGRIGGMVKIATLTEPNAMVNELETRLKRLDNVLEEHLKKEANEGVKKLFEIAKPAKDEAGKAKKGKAGANIHDLFETIKTAKKLWSVDDAEAHALGLEAIVAKGDLTPEEEAHKLLEAELVRMFGGWNDVYADSGKVDKNGRPIKVKVRDGAGAERRNAALDLATDVWKSGYLDYQKKKKAEAERRETQRLSLQTATGKAGLESETRKAEAVGMTWVGGLKEKFFSLLNFDQLVTWVFGDNEVGRWFIDEQRRAENQKIDEVQQVADSIEDLFTSLAGGDRFAGERLHYAMTRRSLTAKSETGDVVPLSELEAISALLMWMQEDGKRHLKGKRDENGKIISKWAYGQDFIDEIYSKLSKNGYKVLGFLINQYSQEYESLNAVYKEIYGINMPRNANYSPLTVKPQQATNGQTVDPTTGNTVSAGSFTPGSLRTRAQVSAQPDFRDAIATLLSHKKQIAHWKANAVLMREASGVIGNRDLGDSVSASSGKEAVKILRKWIDMIAQGGNRDAAAGTALVELYDRMTGRAASMALVGRVGTLMIQSTQLMAASAAMPTASFALRMSKLLTGRLGWNDALDSAYMQRRLAQAPVHVRLAMDGLRATEPTRLKHAVREAGQLLSATDARFTAGTYAIVFDYQLKQAKKNGSSDPVADAHAETERIVENLAQPTRMGTRSFYELSATSPIAKLAWAFGSDARKNFALLGYTMAKGTNAEKARAFLFVVLLNGVLAGVVRNAWRDLRDDEDEEIFDDKYWNVRRLALSASTDWLFGFPVIGEEIQGAIFAAAGEYRPDSGLFSSIAQAPGAFKNLFIDFDSTDVLRDVEKIATAVGLFNDSAAAGVSVLHIIRDVFDLGSNLIPD